jgi:hypothetical protein
LSRVKFVALSSFGQSARLARKSERNSRANRKMALKSERSNVSSMAEWQGDWVKRAIGKSKETMNVHAELE